MDHNDGDDSSDSPESNRTWPRDYRYYRAAARLARVHAPGAATALDVGPCDKSFLDSIDWVPSRTAIAVDSVQTDRPASSVLGDSVPFEPAARFDLIFCLQALEHFPRPALLLRWLLRAAEIVVVSVPSTRTYLPETGHRHDPVDEIKLQRRARRRWVDCEVVEDEGRVRLVAVFRAGEIITTDFGESDDERAWLDQVTASIDAVRLPRRRLPFPETVHARLFKDDPLRKEMTGSFGVYVVRALWNALGFDEHRKFRWRLEHKLVQSRVFNRYLGREFPESWGVDSLSRQGLRRPLIDALLSGGLFAKETLGHLSGDFGEADATQEVLESLIRGDEAPQAGTPVGEKWLVQERIAVEREYRVHSLEDRVLPGMTFDRYGAGSVPEERALVNAYVESILARLPDALVGESLYAWDVARLADGRFRIFEANLAGFHPVYERGFQVSGFFQFHPHGPPLLVELARHVASTYNLVLELSDDWTDEPNRHAFFVRVLRHYWDRQPVQPGTSAVVARAGLPPERLDAVLSLRAEDLDRFTLLCESIEATGAPFGTLWITIPDADLAAVAASGARARPGCVFIPESELVPELSDFPDARPGVRRQVARLALVARTEGPFCFDLSADVISVRRFRTTDLIRSGKAYYSRTIKLAHAERYEAAEELLGLRRSGWVHGTTPHLFSKDAVADLAAYLERRSAGTPSNIGSWRRFLLGRVGWALGHVYFTFLEAFGLEERDYFPGEADLADNCVLSAEDWDAWDPEASFDEYGSFYFSVVQVGPDVPAEAVRRRLAPHLGLAVTGGPRQMRG